MEPISGDDFCIECLIGEGMFGDVHKSIEKRTGETFALKKIRKSYSGAKDLWSREYSAGKLLNQNKNVPKVKGAFKTSSGYWIAMEFIDSVDLIRFMELRKFQPLSEELTKRIFRQIIKTMIDAHRKGIAHLDLKLENILIDLNNNIKIIDWGLSEIESPLKCTRRCGSVDYCAPEVNFCSNSRPYNAFRADVFSLGVILYTLLFGRFSRDICSDSFTNIGSVSIEAKNLLEKMTDSNPNTRITLEDIENHKWLQLNHKMSVALRRSQTVMR